MILELRKSKSNNKKYKYIYQLVYNDTVMYTRKSKKVYAGAFVEHDGAGLKCTRFFTNPANAILLAAQPAMIALTFDSLRTIYRAALAGA